MNLTQLPMPMIEPAVEEGKYVIFASNGDTLCDLSTGEMYALMVVIANELNRQEFYRQNHQRVKIIADAASEEGGES